MDNLTAQAETKTIKKQPKAGILGGGQLGRMLLQQAINYPVITYVMDVMLVTSRRGSGHIKKI